jgi:hypothetical protein
MYINTITNQYPVSEADIKAQYPNTSFTVPFVPPDGYSWVFPTPQPSFNSIIEQVVETSPEFTAKGHWEQRWQVVSKFGEYTDQNGVIHSVADQETAVKTAAQAEKDLALQKNIEFSTQERLDTFARSRSYDDIKSASTYAGCSVPRFDTEGTYCRDIRAQTWNILYDLLDQVKAGTIPKPNHFSDIEPLLPVLEWPATQE